jgi:hypothetical protein
MSDPKTIDEKNEVRTRTAAVEAGSIPEQTSNDEGRAQDLQIEEREMEAADDAMKLQLNRTRRARRRCMHSGQGRLDSGLPETLFSVRVK